MSNHDTIATAASAFLDALYVAMRQHSERIAASGDPDAAKDHYALMMLHHKLSTVPYDSGDWQTYADNVTATTEAFHRHLKSGGYYGAPIIKSIMRDILYLLDKHTPAISRFRRLTQYLAFKKHGPKPTL